MTTNVISDTVFLGWNCERMRYLVSKRINQGRIYRDMKTNSSMDNDARSVSVVYLYY